MKTVFICAAAAIAFAATEAGAADMYERGSLKDAPAVYSVSNWAGLYLGGHLGGAFGAGDNKGVGIDFFNPNGTFDDTNPANFAIDQGTKAGDDEFLIGGLHIGYNFQGAGSPWVLGVEGDISFADEVDYVATLRARLGYAYGNALFYITGGVAFADFGDSLDVKYIGTRTDISLFDKSGGEDTETGFVLGAGAEFKLKPNLSLGVEGLYYGFDDIASKVVFLDDDLIDDEFATFSQKVDPDFWVIRARLTYHLHSAPEPLK